MIGPKKKIFYKTYTPAGVLLTESWNDAKFEHFVKSINGGYGECVITLPRQFDDFGENNDVRLNNRVEIHVSDKDSNDAIIYSGFISSYQPYIEDGRQGVRVSLLGYHAKLSQDVYKNGTTTTIVESAVDIGTIVQNIFTRYLAETSIPDVLIYGGVIDTVGQNASYTFQAMTYFDAIETARRLAPAGWYWYLDSNNIFHFKLKATSAVHKFYYGKHFEEIKSDKNMENIINEVLLFDGQVAGVYKKYSDVYSQGQYGRRVYKETDRNFGDTTTMDNYAQSILDAYNIPDISVKLTVFDNNENNFGYNIESIEVGDTVNIEGFNDQLFDEEMVITEYEYLIDKIILTIKPVKNDIFNKVYQLDKEIEKEKEIDLPTDYTT